MKDFDITIEQVREIADIYGVKITEGGRGGLYVDGREVSVEELFSDWNIVTKERLLLAKLLAAYTELDTAFCTYVSRGDSGLMADKYEELEDVAIEVEMYLKGEDGE